MAVEIERKFLVSNESWRDGASVGQRLRQAYIASSPACSVRLRVMGETHAKLTIKSGFRGLARDEFEYDIPVADAVAMFELRRHEIIIDKTRYRVEFDGLTWEVDVFSSHNDGLIVAEIELTDEAQAVSHPPWIGAEVTYDLRYQNSQLAIAPYTSWNSAE